MFVANASRGRAVRAIVHRAVGVSLDRGLRIRRPIKRRLGRLQRQSHNQLKRQQHKQCSFRGQGSCGTASHVAELTLKTRKGDTV